MVKEMFKSRFESVQAGGIVDSSKNTVFQIACAEIAKECR